MTQHKSVTPLRQMFNKVPEITLYFWIIKILCTTVGETVADFLNVNLNFGLSATSVVMGVLLAIALTLQLRSQKYVPALYWTTVAFVSVFGTLVTDNLTDNLGLALEASTLIFGGLLALTFLAWYRTEKTLSIHSIFTRRREIFYWLAILFTFALGTAAGDLVAEKLGLGYSLTGLIVAAVIAVTAVAWRVGLNSILSFWIIYILTRPLGASIGDFLSQPTKHGGLGLGATLTSAIFVVGILVIVTYLAVKKVDVIQVGARARSVETPERGGMLQTIIVVLVLAIVGGSGYYLRKSALDREIASAATQTDTSGGSGSPLGDLSTFQTITQDTLDLLAAGDQAGATNRVGDLEYEWDSAQSILKAKDGVEWTSIDSKIDTVLRELRSTSPNSASETSALQALLGGLT